MYIDNRLINFCLKHKMFPEQMKTTDGKNVVVSDPGLFNTKDGAQFFNAKVRIDNTLFIGNVMTFCEASSWSFREHDRKYDNVILVFCHDANAKVLNSKGEEIPVVEVVIPENVDRNSLTLLEAGGDTLCHQHIMEYSSQLMRHAWFAALGTEFLENELEHLQRYYKECGKDLNETFFYSVFRAFGFTTNRVETSMLARHIPLEAMNQCRDDLFQIEAIILGQAGLLEIKPEVQCAIPDKYFDKAMNEGYFSKLRNEYLYLHHKYDMHHSCSKLIWNPFGKGGLSYPHVVLSMLANWWYCWKMTAESALNIETVKEAMDLFNTHCTPYWETHNIFGAESKKCQKCLSDDKKAWLVVACLVPYLFFVGRLRSDEYLCDRAFDFMDQVKCFSTPETKHFKEFGLEPRDAGEALAMTYMKNKYCTAQCRLGDARLCLKCRFGYEFIKKH